MAEILLPCDGCGQLADSAHISRRLERLAWSTRFRPLHIQTLLLSGIAPKLNADFLYAPDTRIQGEAQAILDAIPLSTSAKSAETIQAEFQKLGLMLTHVLECPLGDSVPASQMQTLLEKQLPATIARLRHSLKPKRVLLVSADLVPQAQRLHEANLQCPVFPFPAGVFLSTSEPDESSVRAFRAALCLSNALAV
jgi:hypothetical protein